jgi:hypothetical protein
MTIYEVKKYGVTVEWTNRFKDAQEAYKDTDRGECFLIKRVNGVPQLLERK